MASDLRNGDLPAGDFASWLSAMQAALRGDADAGVPCGTCTACCTSSQFVPIGPDETDTLAHIPAELLFPAPRLAKGHHLLGYDEHGHCPMLTDGRCSIYEHRPRTCRTYDCRIFAATGLDIDADDPTKDPIARRVKRWRFTHPTNDDRRRQDAVRVAVRTVRGTSVTQLAVAAIEHHEEFLAQQPGVRGNADSGAPS
jgi:Fe-S-cluster containining protein